MSTTGATSIKFRILFVYLFLSSFCQAQNESKPDNMAAYQMTFDELYFEQIYKYPHSTLKVASGASFSLLKDLHPPRYEVRSIYFRDGTIDTLHRKVVSVWVELDTPKLIDSIKIATKHWLPTSYQKHTLSYGDKVMAEGGTMQFDSINSNYIHILFDNLAGKVYKVEALNKDGKVLSPLSINKGTFGMPESFSTTSTKTFYSGWFEGNIDMVNVYVGENIRTIENDLIIYNCYDMPDIICVRNRDGLYGFIDQTGKEVIPFQYKEKEQINSVYYTLDLDNYFLNIRERKLEKLDIDTMAYLNYNMIMGSYTNTQWAIFNDKGKPITRFLYDRAIMLGNSDKLIITTRNEHADYENTLGLMDIAGKIIFDDELSNIGELEENRILLKKDLKPFAFADGDGNIVIPLDDYDAVGYFSDGLAAVSKNRLQGYINELGKIVIPLQYSGAYPFENGITMVRDTDGNRGLINKQGEIIVPFEASYGTIEYHNDERIYVIDNTEKNSIKYNSFGVRIREEEMK